MKARLTLLTLAALFIGACTSGTYVTSSYTDDVYFNPGDVPPPISAEEILIEEETAEKSAHRMIISDIERNEEGSQTMNNYIFDGSEEDSDALVYSMDQYDLYESDTTVYYNDDDVKYVINNYYDGDDIDYAYRIRRFHRPHFYDPFYWDSWYYGSSFYDPFYYDPFYYSSWYSPYYSWGWGHSWYSPYYSWGWGYSPYYSSWYSPYSSYYGWGYPYSSWYGGYGGGYGGGWYADSDNYRYGQRRSTATNVTRSNDSGGRTAASGVRTSATTTKSVRDGATSTRTVDNNRRSTSTSGVRQDAGTRPITNGRVVTERRRTSSDQNIQGVNSNGNTQTRVYTRPGTTTTTRTYTRPATKSTTTPRVVTQSSRSGSNYTAPRSTSTYNRTYRTNSTYNRSSSSSSATRSYRAPSTTTKSGSSYSAPSRSSSSGSYRSSGSSSSRSYTPSSSGSSGSSRSSSSSSSSSGRRR